LEQNEKKYWNFLKKKIENWTLNPPVSRQSTQEQAGRALVRQVRTHPRV